MSSGFHVCSEFETFRILIFSRFVGDFDGALKLHLSHLNISRCLNDRSGIARAYSNIGHVYSSIKRWKDAIKYHLFELNICRELHDRGAEASTHANLAVAYEALSMPDKAIHHFTSHLSIARQMNDYLSESTALSNLGHFYFARREYSRALEYYKQLLDKIQNANRTETSRSEEAKANHLLGVTYFALQQYVDALKCFEADLELSKLMQDRVCISRAYCYVGLTKAELGDLEAALEFQKFSLCAAPNNSFNKLDAYGNIAQVLTRKGKFYDAIQMLEKQLSLARTMLETDYEDNDSGLEDRRNELKSKQADVLSSLAFCQKKIGGNTDLQLQSQNCQQELQHQYQLQHAQQQQHPPKQTLCHQHNIATTSAAGMI